LRPEKAIPGAITQGCWCVRVMSCAGLTQMQSVSSESLRHFQKENCHVLWARARQTYAQGSTLQLLLPYCIHLSLD